MYHPVQGPVKAHIQTLIERGLPAACAASIRSAEASDPALDTPPRAMLLIPTMASGPLSAGPTSASSPR